jgi:hypothetical protein
MAKRKRGNSMGSLFQRGRRGAWLAAWFDHTGRRCVRSTRTTDRAAAERILSKFVADVALRREGVVDVEQDELTKAARLCVTWTLNFASERNSHDRQTSP